MLSFAIQKMNIHELSNWSKMHVFLVKYHVYQQLKADEHNATLNMTTLQFEQKWTIIYDSLRHFENGY